MRIQHPSSKQNHLKLLLGEHMYCVGPRNLTILIKNKELQINYHNNDKIEVSNNNLQ